MNERREHAPRPLPMTLFDANAVEPILKQKKELLLPEGTKALLILATVRHGFEELNLGPITLKQPVRGDYLYQATQPYHELPPKSVRMGFVPHSDLRNELKVRSQQWPAINDPEVEAIDKQLAAEFLADRQDDLEFFNIDPSLIKQVRLQVAISREVKIFS